MRCEYQYFRIFDFGGFLEIEKARRVLEGAFLVQGVAPIKGAPEYVSFAPALSIDFAERGHFEFENGVPCKVGARIYHLGAVAIHFESSFDADSVDSVRQYWDYALRKDGKSFRKSDIAKDFFEEIRRKLTGSLLDRYDVEVYPEYYTFFTLERKDGTVSDFISQNRRALASLLISEKSPARLGDKEIDEILGSPYSYYHDEVSFVDWDATVTVCADLKGNEDTLAVLEAANLQLLELRTYDAYLDKVIEKSSADLRTMFAPGGFFKSRARRVVGDLAETRVELEKMVDEINNVAKFFGDWYIARVYLGCRKKLHIDRWLDSVQEKLNTLGDLYTFAANEATNRRLLLLELLIVFLFSLDIILLLLR